MRMQMHMKQGMQDPPPGSKPIHVTVFVKQLDAQSPVLKKASRSGAAKAQRAATEVKAKQQPSIKDAMKTAATPPEWEDARE